MADTLINTTKVKPSFTLGNLSLKGGVADAVFDFLRVFDALVLLACAYFAYVVRHGVWDLPQHYVGASVMGAVFFLTIAHTLGMYKFRRLRSISSQIWGLFITCLAALALSTTILFFGKIGDNFSRGWSLIWFAMTFVVLLGGHIIVMAWLRRQLSAGRYVRKVAVYGGGAKGAWLLNHFTTQQHVQMVAQFGGDDEKQGIKNFNNFNDFAKYCSVQGVDDVIVAADLDATAQPDKMLAKLRTLSCHVRYCLPLALFQHGLQKDSVWGIPTFQLHRRTMEGRRVKLKRALDLSLSTALLPLFLVMMAGVALAIFSTGQKTLFFRQKRHGFEGNVFHVLKFQTMRVQEDDPQAFIAQATKSDPRITPIGRILRKTSLDEIPQIFNVLRGEMSLVGPRPHAVSHDLHYAELIDSYAARHHVKPGITGWAQVNGWRGETDTDDKMQARVQFDLYYIEHWSVFFDLKILLLTPFSLFSKNAY